MDAKELAERRDEHLRRLFGRLEIFDGHGPVEHQGVARARAREDRFAVDELRPRHAALSEVEDDPHRNDDSSARRDMCKLSTRCTLLVAEHANHRIPEEQPAAVVDAIARAVTAAR